MQNRIAKNRENHERKGLKQIYTGGNNFIRGSWLTAITGVPSTAQTALHTDRGPTFNQAQRHIAILPGYGFVSCGLNDTNVLLRALAGIFFLTKMKNNRNRVCFYNINVIHLQYKR